MCEPSTSAGPSERFSTTPSIPPPSVRRRLALDPRESARQLNSTSLPYTSISAPAEHISSATVSRFPSFTTASQKPIAVGALGHARINNFAREVEHLTADENALPKCHSPQRLRRSSTDGRTPLQIAVQPSTSSNSGFTTAGNAPLSLGEKGKLSAARFRRFVEGVEEEANSITGTDAKRPRREEENEDDPDLISGEIPALTPIRTSLATSLRKAKFVSPMIAARISEEITVSSPRSVNCITPIARNVPEESNGKIMTSSINVSKSLPTPQIISIATSTYNGTCQQKQERNVDYNAVQMIGRLDGRRKNCDVKAYLHTINVDTLTYLGCYICKKKVNNTSESTSCIKCRNAETRHYFAARSRLSDFSGSIYVTVFDEIGELLGLSAEECSKMQKYMPDELTKRVRAVEFIPKVFQLSMNNQGDWLVNGIKEIDYNAFQPIVAQSIIKKGYMLSQFPSELRL